MIFYCIDGEKIETVLHCFGGQLKKLTLQDVTYEAHLDTFLSCTSLEELDIFFGSISRSEISPEDEATFLPNLKVLNTTSCSNLPEGDLSHLFEKPSSTSTELRLNCSHIGIDFNWVNLPAMW